MAASYAEAQSLSDYYRKVFVMPGPVIVGHAAFEQKCKSCHAPPDYKRVANKLCLSCHKTVGQDLSQKRGMHGRRVDIRGTSCTSCHGEHKGRDFAIIGLDRELFNHDLTDFKLTGPHRAQSCDKCHAAGEKFRKAGSRCRDCHASLSPSAIPGGIWRGAGAKAAAKAGTKTGRKSGPQSRPQSGTAGRNRIAAHSSRNPRLWRADKTTDPHFGRLPDCAICHKVSSWLELKPFDHAKASARSPHGRFILKGHHAKAACASCHAGEHYRNIARLCVSCHILQDHHAGNFGRRCNLCHGQKSWSMSIAGSGRGRRGKAITSAISVLRKISFDHGKTGFALIGNHKTKAKCEGCHKTSFNNTPHNCFACHKKKDVHKGLLGKKCQSCHTPLGFNKLIKLRGGLSPLANAIVILKKARFDHAKTRFPLIGNHKTKAKCEGCHKTSFRKTPTTCISCHKKKDVHKGRFGRKCQSCHSPTGWKIFGRGTGGRGTGAISLQKTFQLLRKAKFNHKNTRFPLTGRHRRTDCKNCHVTSFKGTPRDCYSCHKREGRRAHGRRAATRYRNCARCHSTRHW